MCGLIGSIGLKDDSRLNPGLISHRGPDGMGFWNAPENEYPVSLGHTRLAILDLSEAGNQPMFSMNDRYVFVFNGEIYNFVELRTELEKKGLVFTTRTDTEVFLKGLINEGPAFQLRCNGMWSFCLWDREKRTALFGRDRFGKKPLFYAWVGSSAFVFASEMKAIYPFLKSITPSRNIEVHLRNLFNYESTEYCVVDGIQRLPPGHYATLMEGRLKTFRWWNTLDHLVEPPPKYEDQVELWRELFLDAVKIRMRSDVPIGTALSGGLDSSATFLAMAYITKRTVAHTREAKDWQHGFCAHYPGSSLDETKWAQVVTKAAGIQLNEVFVDPMLSSKSLLSDLYQVEDPFLTMPTPMLATYAAISRSGIKVTLDGHGADELFSGYGHLVSAFSNANPRQLADLIATERSTRTGLYAVNKKYLHVRWLKYKANVLASLLMRTGYRSVKAFFGRIAFDEIFASSLQYADQSHPAFKKFDPFTKQLYEIFHVTVLPTLLRNYDRYSMASGVEIRMPFLDYRLVTYTFALPWTSKVGDGYTKRIMRDALKGILPEEIRTRRDKIGWNAPLHEWFKGPLKKEIEEFINKNSLPSSVKEAWREFQNKQSPVFQDGQRVWDSLLPWYWRASLRRD